MQVDAIKAAGKPPARLDASEQGGWQDEADVVLVGLGLAGVSAALEALDHQADVLGLDAYAGGGATRLSGGVCYAGGTRFQREAGVDDTPEDMLNYLRAELDDTASEDLLRDFSNASAGNLDWLVSQGATFNSNLTEEKTSYPGEGYFLYYSGNERLPEYRAIARPAPRGHVTFDENAGSGPTGHVLFDTLLGTARAKGLRVKNFTPVRRLVIDHIGRVAGVEAQVIHGIVGRWLYRSLTAAYAPLNPFLGRWNQLIRYLAGAVERSAGRPYRIRARKGVVLSAGGMISNRDLVAAYAPIYLSTTAQGSIGCDGSGIALGVSAGAATFNMSRVNPSRSITPPSAFVKGIVVNRKGQRFLNEEVYLSVLGREIAEKQGGLAWQIVDAKMMAAARDQLKAFRPGSGRFFYGLTIWLNLYFGGTKKSNSIAGLAQKLGMPPGTLEAEVSAYNRGAKNGQDRFGKSADYNKPIENRPFYAVNTSTNRPLPITLSFTLGGLQVDHRTGAVLREDGSVVAGLYAAGRTAAGLPANGYVSGLSLADCVYSGRQAAAGALSPVPDQAR